VETDGRRRETVPVKKDSRPEKREIEREALGGKMKKISLPTRFRLKKKTKTKAT
jgi:hypothetical protein